MKQVISAFVMSFSLLTLMTGCSKSNISTAPSTPVNPSTVVVSGSWVVSSLTQRDEDKTSQLKDYVFTFASEGTLKADKSGSITDGTWAYTPSSVGYYGSTPSNSSIRITLAAGQPLSLLNKVWNVDSTATTAAKLALISPEVAENMRLVFTKK